MRQQIIEPHDLKRATRANLDRLARHLGVDRPKTISRDRLEIAVMALIWASRRRHEDEKAGRG